MVDCAVIKHFERAHDGMCYTVFNRHVCVYDDVVEIWVTTTHLIMLYDGSDDLMMRIVSLSDVEDIQIYEESIIVDNKEES